MRLIDSLKVGLSKKSLSPETTTAQILYFLIANTLFSLMLYGVLSLTDPVNIIRLLASLVILPIWLILLALLRRGHIQPVKLAAVTLNVALSLLQLGLDGGFSSPSFFDLLIASFLAAIAYGRFGLLVTLVISLASSYSFSFLLGITPFHNYSSLEISLMRFSDFLVVSLCFYFYDRSLKELLNRKEELAQIVIKNETRLRDLIMNLPIGCLVMSSGGQIRIINNRLSEIIGIRQDDLATLDDLLYHVYPDPIKRAKTHEFFREHLQSPGKNVLSLECQVVNRDGEQIDIEVFTSFFEDNIIVLFNDISERKKAQELLRASEEQYHRLFDNMISGIMVFELIYDDDGNPIDYRLIQANPAFEKMTGTNREKSIGKTSIEFSSGGDEVFIRNLFRIANYGGSIEYERFNDLIGLYYEGRIFSPRKGQFAIVFNDISNRKHSEEKIKLQLTQIQKLRQLDLSMLENANLDVSLNLVLETVLWHTEYDLAVLSILDKNNLPPKIYYKSENTVLDPEQYTKSEHFTQLLSKNETIRLVATSYAIEAGGVEYKNYIAIPMLSKGRVVGFLEIYSKSQTNPDSDWFEYLDTLTGQVSMAIEESLLLQAEQDRRKSLETIEAISIDLRKASNKSSLFSHILKNCLRHLGATAGLAFDFQNDILSYFLSKGIDWPAKDTIFENRLNAKLVEFAHSNQTVTVFDDEYPSYHSVALVKLQSDKSFFGVIVLFWKNKPTINFFFHTLQQLSEIGGIALERMQLFESLDQGIKNRTRELRALYEISSLYVSNEDIQFVIDESLKIILDTIHATAGIIFLSEDSGMHFNLTSHAGFFPLIGDEARDFNLREFGWGPVLKSNKPVLLNKLLYPFLIPGPDVAKNTTNLIGVPIRTEKILLGVLGILLPKENNITLDELSLINLLSDQLGMVIERNMLRQQSKNAAIMEERQRLSRELHDSLTQSLYSLKLISDAGKRLAIQQKWDDVITQLELIHDISMQGLKEMRLLVYELVPDTIEQHGLIAALEKRLNYVERRAGIVVDFIVEGTFDFSPDTKVNIYRITQEALNNAVKHASATKIQVKLINQSPKFMLSISDNGKGFDPSGIALGMGLKNMQDRARKLGGQIQVISKPETGTTVLFETNEELL